MAGDRAAPAEPEVLCYQKLFSRIRLMKLQDQFGLQSYVYAGQGL
jgi:hypothetical protein